MDGPVLRVVLSDGNPAEFLLDQPVMTVGRSDDNAIHLDDLSVSRRHARFSREGDNLYLEDLGSGGGTFLAGRQLTPRTRYLVNEGDTLRFGELEGRYRPPTVQPAAEPDANVALPLAAVGLAGAAALAATGVAAAASKEDGPGAIAEGSPDRAGETEATETGVPAAELAPDPDDFAFEPEPVAPAEPEAAPIVAPAPAVPDVPAERIMPRPAYFEAEPLRPPEPPVVPLPPAVVAAPTPVSGVRLSANLPSEPLEAGRALSGTLSVQNRGHVVEEVRLSVEGDGAAWTTLGATTLTLMPGAHEDVPVTVRPPREAKSQAGFHSLEIVGLSATTGVEQRAAGSFSIVAFGALAAAISPAQGSKTFDLTLRNDGNAPLPAQLFANDDEAALKFVFDRQSVTVPAGGEEHVRLKASGGRRPFTGAKQMKPFSVSARPDSGPVPPALTAQLTIKPIIGSLWPLLALLALLFLGVIGALAFFLWPSSDTKVLPAAPTVAPTATATPTPLPPDKAELPFAGVHLCAPTDPGPPPAPGPGLVRALPSILASFRNAQGGDPTAPLYAQNDSRWGQREYAKASDNEFRSQNQCGATIAQCGCAMTSVATIMSLFGVIAMPDGTPLTPDQLNTWLDGGAVRTPRGWVSRGYIYGDVVWSAANQLSAEIAKARPGTPKVRFVTVGSGREEQIRSELAQGRPVILEVPGHWIAAIGVDPATGKILINDPFYADRKTLDAYAGKVKSSVLFEKSEDLSAVVISAPSDLRIKVSDSQGHVVGTFQGGTPVDAQSAAALTIPGATYAYRDAWRDPNCIEKAPPPGSGINQIVLPAPAEGTYTVEVLNPGGGGTNVAIHSYDKDGNLTLITEDKPKFDVVVGGKTPTPTPTGTATATATGTRTATVTSTSTSSATPTATSSSTDTPTPTATSSSTPTPTATVTLTPTATTTRGPAAPSPVAINCTYQELSRTNSSQTSQQVTFRLRCTGTEQGTYTRLAWYTDGVQETQFIGFTYDRTFTRSSDTQITVLFEACNQSACASAPSTLTITFVAGNSN